MAYGLPLARVATSLFRLPDGQEMEFAIHSAGVIDNNPDLHWCFFAPVPGTDTEERLLRLLEEDSLIQ